MAGRGGLARAEVGGALVGECGQLFVDVQAIGKAGGRGRCRRTQVRRVLDVDSFGELE